MDYHCTTCRFDRALRRVCDQNKHLRKQGKIPKGKKSNIVFWKEKIRERSPGKRPCIHHMKERIDFKACNRDYRCVKCEFDQYFQDQFTVHAVVKPVGLIDIEGFKIPQGFYLHQGHTWLRVEQGSEVRIGIDDFALRLLGPLDRIEAPLVGKAVKQGRNDIRICRGTKTAKVRSPISGVVTAINPKVRENGRRANQDPYSNGWILRVHSKTLRQELKSLMLGNQTKHFLETEVNRLYRKIEDEAGLMATDGGQLGYDIFGNIPQVGWNRLVEFFLQR